MQKSSFVRSLSFFLVIVATCWTTGCAGQDSQVKESAEKPPEVQRPVAAKKRPEQTGEVLTDEKGEYTLARTPFGYVKQRARHRGPGITESAPPPVSEPATPKKVGAVVPPKAADPGRLAPPPAKPAKKTVPGPAEDRGKIVFNFDDADLHEVIRTMGELLEINYMVAPDVGGKVTIHTARGLRKEDLYSVFLQILELNGLTAVKEGSLHRVINLKDVSRAPILSRIGRETEEIPPSERVVIQIVPLRYIQAGEMVTLLEPFISANGTVVTHQASNTLIVVDKGINILKVVRLIDVFDIDMLSKTNHKFYEIKNTDVEEVSEILGQILASHQTTGKAGVKFIPLKRLNTLLAISSNPEIFDKVDGFVQELDVASEATKSRIYVYAVKNGEAGELTELLNIVFGKKEAAEETSDGRGQSPYTTAPNPFARGAREEPAPEETAGAEPVGTAGTEPTAGGTAGTGSATLRGEVRITPDEIRNAIIIEAIPRDYRIIENILTRLDILPRQVLIEVTIAEITLDESTQLGIDWTYVKSDSSLSTSLLEATLGAAGFQYTIGNANRWTQTLNALASENKVNILSTPSVLASDNKEAKIDISTEVPVASSQYTYAPGQDSVVSTNIEYRDTGVILTVTPHVSDHGMVSMEVTQEVSEQAGDVLVAGENYPSFFKRNVTTTLTIGHAQTVVIGGLISETKDETISGAPCLIDIPAFRWLFGTEKTSIRKTELIVMITPNVITNLEDVDAVTKEFKGKVKNVIEAIGG